MQCVVTRGLDAGLLGCRVVPGIHPYTVGISGATGCLVGPVQCNPVLFPAATIMLGSRRPEASDRKSMTVLRRKGTDSLGRVGAGLTSRNYRETG